MEPTVLGQPRSTLRSALASERPAMRINGRSSWFGGRDLHWAIRRYLAILVVGIGLPC